MCKLIKKYSHKLLIIYFSLFSINVVNAAQILSEKTRGEIMNQDAAVSVTAGYNDYLVSEIIALIITAFLSLLALIFVILMLYAGYNWMTASGEEEKVTKAKNTIQRAIIGLIIVASAYAITYFIFNNMPWGQPTP